MARRDLAAAVRGYQVVTHLAPGDTTSADAFSRLLAATGHTSAAACELLRLAALYVDSRDPRKAIAAANRAWTYDPAVLVRHRMAPLLFRLGEPIETLCLRAVEQHVLDRRLVDARDLLHLMVDARPRSTHLRLRLAELELELGHPDRAIRGLRLLAELHRSAHDTDAFVATVERLIDLGGADPQLIGELVALDLQAGRSRRALERLERLGRQRPSDLDLLERIATLQAELGCTPSALETLWRLVRALGKADDTPRIRALLRRASRWHPSARYRDAVATLARQVLSAQDASELNAPGWVFFGPRDTAPSDPSEVGPVNAALRPAETQPLFVG